MLVVLTDNQVLTVQQVCPNCLLANQQGLPRWQQGHLSCAKQLAYRDRPFPSLYECQMGFQLAQVEGY
jgi:hypothetical protein